MVSGPLLSDDLVLPEMPAQSPHPMDASRILIGLMSLSRQAEEDVVHGDESDNLSGLISRTVLRRLLSALHFRDVATVRHSRRVAMLASGMARYLGWEGRELKLIEISGLLHDLGKIGVPDNILFKPGALGPEEAGLMALHQNIGVDVLQACRVDREILEIVGHAHDHYRGTSAGMHGLGREVHQGARILAVADAYDSLASDQVYRSAKPHEEIMQILMDAAGTQFDGNIVCALARWIDAEGAPIVEMRGEAQTVSTARGPAHPDETLDASSLCHIFSYLYLLESLYDGFYLLDSDMRFVVWNRGAEGLLGYSAHDILGQVWSSRLLGYSDDPGRTQSEGNCPINRVLATEKPVTALVPLRRRDGSWVDVELQAVPLLDETRRLQGVVEIFRDLSRSGRRPQEFRELKLAASRDALTSVANRGELETRLAELLKASSENPELAFSVIFLDIDHFKSINDTYGHAVGDRVLIEVARLIQHETYSGELLGRYGGEEFVLLCPDTDLEHAYRRAERLRHAISRMTIPETDGLQVTASFGVTQMEPGDSVESIFRRADKALYRAKDAGRNTTRRLTSADLLADAADEAETGSNDRLVYRTSFLACVQSDMVIYKLGGFVDDQKARLVEVAPRRAVIRSGQTGLLPFWGKTDAKRPVELEIEFGQEHEMFIRGRRSVSRRVEIRICVRPLGWVRDVEAFQARARRITRILRSYFLAE